MLRQRKQCMATDCTDVVVDAGCCTRPNTPRAATLCFGDYCCYEKASTRAQPNSAVVSARVAATIADMSMHIRALQDSIALWRLVTAVLAVLLAVVVLRGWFAGSSAQVVVVVNGNTRQAEAMAVSFETLRVPRAGILGIRCAGVPALAAEGLDDDYAVLTNCQLARKQASGGPRRSLWLHP